MSRYVDVNVIDKKVSDAYDTWTDDTAEHVVARNLLKSTHKFLLELPSIDIVKCKECIHWDRAIDESGIERFNFSKCTKGHCGNGLEFYCADGEREEP